MRHGCSGAGKKLAVGFGQEGAVRQDGLLAQKAEVVEGLCVRLAVTGRRHALLPLPLGAVRLHVGARLLGDATQADETLVGAAGDEARGHHAVDALARRCADLCDFSQQRLGVCQGLGRGGVAVEVGVGSRVVHDDLAHERALATLGADACELDGGGQVVAGEVDRRGGAQAEQAAHQVAVDRTGEIEIGKACFKGKRSLLEPHVERLVEGDTCLGPLRGVYVHIHKAGQAVGALRQLDERAGVAGMLHASGVVGGIGAHHVGDKAARVHLNQHVFEHFNLAVAGRVEKRTKESRGRYGSGHAKISLLQWAVHFPEWVNCNSFCICWLPSCCRSSKEGRTCRDLCHLRALWPRCSVRMTPGDLGEGKGSASWHWTRLPQGKAHV